MTNAPFICIANCGRTQMAGVIFNHMAPEGMKAIGAGNNPARKVRPFALAVLNEAGIDASTLRLKLLTREIAQTLWVDKIQSSVPVLRV